MSSTLILQSHKKPLTYTWLAQCMDSVRYWALKNKFEYVSIGDELFDYVPIEILNKTRYQKVIATDLARIKALRDYLNKGFETVIWCDADFFVFAPDSLLLHALGRKDNLLLPNHCLTCLDRNDRYRST